MKEELSHYTLGVSPELMEKLSYIAGYECRTKNEEIEHMIKKYIRAFERVHGLIPPTGKD